MGTVLYEFSSGFSGLIFYIVPLIVLPAVLFDVARFAKQLSEVPEPLVPASSQPDLSEWEEPADAESPGCLLIFLRLFAAFLGIIFFFVCVFSILEYAKLSNAYKQGDYAIVEGYVENYHPLPYSGHGRETFELDGVPFSYADAIIQWGYHNAASHGGVIDREGQHLRIGYYPGNSAEKNIILYIEALPGDADDS